MTSAQVVETSVTNNSSFQNDPHPGDHTIRTSVILDIIHYLFYRGNEVLGDIHANSSVLKLVLCEGLFWHRLEKDNTSKMFDSTFRKRRYLRVLGPVSRKPWNLFGPLKPLLVHLYLKTERCIRLKLLV